jgi:peptidoglycan/LPS O-acetylase OafA/YrhL
VPANVQPAKHLAYLDGWRALAAIWVVIHHAWFTVQDRLSGVSAKILAIFSYGRVSVDLFIVLSGFCLMLPVLTTGVLRGGALQFLRRRAWRILPPYYCALAFSLLLVLLFIHRKTGTHWDTALPVTLRSILDHLFLVQDAFGDDYKINHVFWSIAVEWRIYFFFPLLVWGWRYLGPFKTALSGFAASCFLFWLCRRLIGATLTFNYLGLFVMGMLGAGIVFPHSPSLSRARKLPWGWVTLFLTLAVLALYNMSMVKNAYRDFGVGLWSMSALIATSVNREAWPHRMLALPPIAFVGTFAYSIYLIHAPLLQILWQYVFVLLQPHPVRMFAALTVLGIPAIIVVSYIFFLAFERPFLRRPKPAAAGIVPAPATS